MVGKRVFPFGMVTFHGRAVKLREGRYRKGTGTNAVSCCFFVVGTSSKIRRASWILFNLRFIIVQKKFPGIGKRIFRSFLSPPLDGQKFAQQLRYFTLDIQIPPEKVF